jgi:hypothetical protein
MIIQETAPEVRKRHMTDCYIGMTLVFVQLMTSYTR